MLRILLVSLGLSLFTTASVAATLPADPTKPAGNMSVSPDTNSVELYRVSSLITGKKNNLAIVNNTRVQVGDLVDGAKVIEINRKGVRLLVRGEKTFISLADRKGFSKVQSLK